MTDTYYMYVADEYSIDVAFVRLVQMTDDYFLRNWPRIFGKVEEAAMDDRDMLERVRQLRQHDREAYRNRVMQAFASEIAIHLISESRTFASITELADYFVVKMVADILGYDPHDVAQCVVDHGYPSTCMGGRGASGC